MIRQSFGDERNIRQQFYWLIMETRNVMHNRLSLVTSVLGVPFIIAILAGCQRGPAPAMPHRPERAATKPPAPEEEKDDPISYLERKGWRVSMSPRLVDGKEMKILYISSAANPLDKITPSRKDYEMIAKVESLQFVSISGLNSTDEGMAILATNPSIEAVIVAGDSLTDSGLRHLAKLPKLDYLHILFAANVSGNFLEEFAKSKTLRFLVLEHLDGFTDGGCQNIAKLNHLELLKLRVGFNDNRITTSGIKSIVEGHMPPKFAFNSEFLDDELFSMLATKGWCGGDPLEDHAPTPADVKTLFLANSRITDQSGVALRTYPNVETLSLDHTDVGDYLLEKLANHKRLRVLDLASTKVNGDGLAKLVHLPIQELRLGSCELKENAFKVMSQMKQLHELDLKRAKLQPAWIEHLVDVPRLRRLDLGQTRFDDAAIKHLVNMPALKELSLASNPITDKGFQQLTTIATLQTLNIDHVGSVSDEIVEKVTKQRPRLKIQHYVRK